MATVAIPAWNELGLLPPIDPELPLSPDRSPYAVSLKDLVMRFSTSPERKIILDGFLKYRSAMHELGYVSGFQWINGSFAEAIEMLAGRSPKDIDVVSFVHSNDHANRSDTDLSVLQHDAAKAAFRVDSYIMEVDLLSPRELISWAAYWYSMWSHRRNQAWKGFLQIELAPIEDADAISWLAQWRPGGENP